MMGTPQAAILGSDPELRSYGKPNRVRCGICYIIPDFHHRYVPNGMAL
jgi:hypothetical protein